MFAIVAHHYVVNSGLIEKIADGNALALNSIFLLIFGWGGKTGINCFVLITGYFMCKSNISLKKFLKLLGEIEFYNVIIYLIFLLTGYEGFSIKSCLKSILPFTSLTTNFGGCYIIFILFIPFLNILIKGMDEKKHRILLALCLSVMTLLPTAHMTVTFSYVSWFMVIYFIGSYIRLYPNKIFESTKVCGIAAMLSLIISWCSVVAGAWVAETFNKNIWYYFVADSNKFLAVVTAVFAFMFFKNLKMGYSKVINVIAASAFGVLLIHANSDTMRRWLWQDTLNNIGQYDSSYLVLHTFGSVLGIYIICTLIDMLRIKFIEKPLFGLYDNIIDKRILKKE